MVAHTVKHEVYYSGSWHDVTSEVHEPSETRIARGLTEFGEPKASSLEWRFVDPAAKWVPGNPMSALYGLLTRAMPCRVTVDGSIRCVGEAAVFSPDRTEGFPTNGWQWVDFRADGLIARINSWTEPLRSPMYRMISRRSTLVGHWPMEDGRDATQLSNTLAGGVPATAKLMTFGETEAPDGASSSVQFTQPDNTSRIDFTFEPASSTAGWQVCWAMKLPALPGVTTLQIISWRTSNGYRWIMNILANTYQFKCVDSDGTLLLELNAGFTGAEPNQWVMFRIKASVTAGVVSMEPAWYVQGQTTPYGISGFFAGTVGYLVNGSMNGNAYMDQANVSHIFGVTGGTDNLLGYAARRAFDGYVGELAGDRFTRLLAEEGISSSLIGSSSNTMAMGRQTAATIGDLLKEIASTDRCLIYDARATSAIEMRTRADLYRQGPVVFTYPDHIAPPFNERYDYVGVANRVTVSQRDGGEATAALESGTMSVLPPPNGIGEKKAGVDVNVSDEEELPLIAGWELAQGTLEGPRFPAVTFDLDAVSVIASTVADLEIGDRIIIQGFRYDSLELLILGIQENVRQYRRTVTLTCIPGDVFSEVGFYDDGQQRYDLRTSTLKTGVISTATSMTFRTTDTVFESWSTTAVPYDVFIAGERVRVTAMTAGSIVSGALDQVATVTRSINGVVKAQTSGAEIHIATPGRYAL